MKPKLNESKTCFVYCPSCGGEFNYVEPNSKATFVQCPYCKTCISKTEQQPVKILRYTLLN